MRVLIFCANGIAAFMDFGVGALIISLMTLAFDVPLPPWYLLVGGTLALLPDFDIVLPIIEGENIKSDHHQTLAHRPIVLLPLVTTIGFLIGGWFWAVTAAVCVFWHYVHDTKGFGGAGISWFWPCSQKYWSPLYGAEEPQTPLGHHAMLRELWLRPSSFALCEIAIGLISLAIALHLASVSVLASGALLFLILLGIALVWISYG